MSCIFRRARKVFNIPCALAPNIGTLLVSRFFAGLFASSPLTLAGGTISDIWETKERGFAIALFAAAPYSGMMVSHDGLPLPVKYS
jgi:MFS family permease